MNMILVISSYTCVICMSNVQPPSLAVWAEIKFGCVFSQLCDVKQ